jgi:hypothetical protein
VRIRQPWEEGMTDEELEEVDRKRKEEWETFEKQMVKDRQFERFQDVVRPWVPPFFNLLLHEELAKVIPDAYLQALAGGTILTLAYVFLAWIVGRICFMLPPTMYMVNIWFMPEHRLVAIALLMWWTTVKVIRFIQAERDPWTEISRPSVEGRKNVIKWESFMAIGVLTIMVFLMNGFGYGAPFQGVWILSVIIICATLIPGVGGNSAANIVTLVIVILLGVFTVPEIYRHTLDGLVAFLRPPENKVYVDNTVRAMFDIKWPTRWPGLGMTQDNMWDLFRRIAVYFPALWAAFDSWMGPGIALDVASDQRKKEKFDILSSAAGIYTEPLTYIMLMELVWCWLNGDVFSLLVVFATCVLVKLLWDYRGAMDWVGRGKGVTLIHVRAGYGAIFGEGPEGFRKMLLFVLSIFAWTMVVASTQIGWYYLGYILIGVYMKNERALMIIISVMGMSVPLLMYSLYTRKPMTGALKDAETDAYTPTDAKYDPS